MTFEYLTIAELMRRWQCSRETVRRRRQATRPLVDIETKRGKKRGPGRHPALFWIRDVEQWEQEHQIDVIVAQKKTEDGHPEEQPPE